MFKISRRFGLNVEYFLPAFISTCGAVGGTSTVEGLNNQIGLAYYIGLAAQPSTGKSAAQGISDAAMSRIEKFNKVPLAESIRINAPTVESLIRILSESKAALCMLSSINLIFRAIISNIINLYYTGNFDEANVFFAAMNRYNNGTKEYDQAMWNHFWNAPEEFGRDLTSVRTRIINPRCHLTFAIHIWAVMQALMSQEIFQTI